MRGVSVVCETDYGNQTFSCQLICGVRSVTTLGDRLRKERERLNFSQTMFGEVGGVTKKTQGLYERGERCPDAMYLIAIATLGVDVGYVLDGKREGALVLSTEEAALLDNYRAADEPGRQALAAAGAAYAQSRSKALKTG